MDGGFPARKNRTGRIRGYRALVFYYGEDFIWVWWAA
jgi:hypothetical protein